MRIVRGSEDSPSRAACQTCTSPALAHNRDVCTTVRLEEQLARRALPDTANPNSYVATTGRRPASSSTDCPSRWHLSHRRGHRSLCTRRCVRSRTAFGLCGKYKIHDARRHCTDGVGALVLDRLVPHWRRYWQQVTSFPRRAFQIAPSAGLAGMTYITQQRRRPTSSTCTHRKPVSRWGQASEASIQSSCFGACHSRRNLPVFSVKLRPVGLGMMRGDRRRVSPSRLTVATTSFASPTDTSGERERGERAGRSVTLGLCSVVLLLRFSRIGSWQRSSIEMRTVLKVKRSGVRKQTKERESVR